MPNSPWGTKTLEQALCALLSCKSVLLSCFFGWDAVIYVFFFILSPLPLLLLAQETSILEEYNINWTQKLGAGISGPVR